MAFDQLIDIFTLMFEVAPLILILMLFMTVMKMFEGRMGLIAVLSVGMLLSSSFFLSPVAEGENLQNFYSDSKGFNYLDISHSFGLFNNTDGLQMSNRTFANGTYDTIFSYEETSGTEIKPHKTINFNEDYLQDSILLITKMVYNWTVDDEFRINLYYVDALNSSTTLTLFYNDYITETLSSNVTNDYKYINGGLQHYSSTNQSVYERSTNFYNTYDHSNIYNIWERNHGLSNTLTSLEVRNITVTKDYTIKTNQWITISIKKDSLLWNGSIFNSYKFINIGLYKNDKTHSLIIDDIKINNRITKNKVNTYPFKEFYEFKEITDNTTDRLFFSIDMVSSNYQTLQVSTIEFGIDSGSLELTYNGVLQWTSHELYLNIDGKPDYDHFTGYQFNMQLDDSGQYSIYIFYKWNFNERQAGSNIVTYNYSFQDFVISGTEFSYLHNFEYYGNTNETDIQISFTQYAHKWDILDTEIRKIDYDMEQQILLVHNVDSGGLKVPSVSDLKKAFTDKIVKPITSTLNGIKDEILKPVNTIVLTLGGFTTSLTSIFNKLSDTYTIIGSGFSSMSTTVTSSITSLQSALETAIGAVTTAVNAVKDSVDLVKDAIVSVETAIGDTITAVNAGFTIVQDLLDEFSFGGDFWTLIDAIESGINKIFNGFNFALEGMLDIVAIAGPTLLNYLTDVGNWLVDVAIILTTFLDIAFTIFGTVFLYRIIIGLSNYNETGDINAIYGILETLMSVAEWVFIIFRLIINFIGGILP